ncbi:Transferase and related glycosyltransferases of PMT family [Magnetospirillum sp. LM-5]|uniref:ArnT family glycosyltransferase n=1 Tax=Magnetospirillum sp. LM-5 TaxID=2681466 RepID=UPI00137E9EA9|nr:glycosyltransferase family 39 protein [Magnetospirillum sp. LM-5]CAA7616558.1 Transferase and related glycosyltransferases of PMT family [Magnetospirillum sp. LM-5]
MHSDTPFSRPVRLATLTVAGVIAWRLAILAFASPNLSFDEAQYWAWAQNFQLGYYSKPPMVAWAIAGTTALCGDGEGCVKLSSVLAHLLTAGLLFLLGRDLWNARVGAWAMVAWATLPAVSLSSMLISTDPFLLTCWTGALWCLVRGRARPERVSRWWLGFGLFLGLGLLSKYAMAFFLASLALWLIWDREARPLWKSRGLWAGIGLGLAVYAPNLVWNALNGFVSYEHTKDNANLGGTLFHPDKMAEFVFGQFAVFGPILMVALVMALVAGFRSRAGSTERLLVSFAAPVFLVMTVESLLSRANANWTAPAFVAGVLLAVAWLAGRRAAWLWVSLALNLAAMGGLYHFETIRPLLGERAAKIDPMRRVRGWELVGERLSAILAAHPGARLLGDERKILASLVYYVRPHPFDFAKWNPEGRVRDHYDQTSSLAAGEPLMIYVTQNPEPPQDVIRRFDRAEHIDTIRDHIDLGARGRPLLVWRLTGFRGY